MSQVFIPSIFFSWRFLWKYPQFHVIIITGWPKLFQITFRPFSRPLCFSSFSTSFDRSIAQNFKFIIQIWFVYLFKPQPIQITSNTRFMFSDSDQKPSNQPNEIIKWNQTCNVESMPTREQQQNRGKIQRKLYANLNKMEGNGREKNFFSLYFSQSSSFSG